MNKLKKLVPPWKLCKLIPKGEFEDTVLCWVDKWHTCVLPTDVIPPEQQPFVELRRYTIQGDDIPAPTLQEIMKNTRSDEEYFCAFYDGDGDEDEQEWSIGEGEHDFFVKNGFEGKNPAELALKWWFKMKGIEYEQ